MPGLRYLQLAQGPKIIDTESILFTAASHQSINFGTAMRAPYNSASSWEIWFFPTTLLANVSILSNYNGATPAFFQIYNNLGVIGFSLVGDSVVGNLDVHTAAVLTVNTWNHVVVTYSGANAVSGIHIYVNGVDISLTTDHNVPIVTQTYTGDTLAGNDSANDSNSGYFNRISYWNTVLSSGAVTALYNGGKPQNIKGSTNLVNYYLPGNGADTASTVHDLQSAANGTIVNSAPYKSFAPFRFVLSQVMQVKNYPSLSVPIQAHNMYMPYYQSGNPDVGFDAPDMQVFSIVDPLLPSLIGTLATTYGTYGTSTPQAPFLISGNYIYINYFKGTTLYLNVVDISDPTNPAVVATVDSGITNLQPTGVWKYGNYLYQPGLLLASNKMLITDITNPLSPSITSVSIPNQVSASKWAFIAFVGTQYMYLSTETVTTIYDLSNPLAPNSVGTFTPANVPLTTRVSPDGNYLYMLEYFSNKIEIVDISTPTSPSSVKVLSTPTGPLYVDFANNLAYVPCLAGQCVNMYSVYDPPNAFLAGSYGLPTFVTTGHIQQGNGITIYGNTAYILGIDPTAVEGDAYGFLDIYQL